MKLALQSLLKMLSQAFSLHLHLNPLHGLASSYESEMITVVFGRVLVQRSYSWLEEKHDLVIELASDFSAGNLSSKLCTVVRRG